LGKVAFPPVQVAFSPEGNTPTPTPTPTPLGRGGEGRRVRQHPFIMGFFPPPLTKNNNPKGTGIGRRRVRGKLPPLTPPPLTPPSCLSPSR